MWHFGKTFRFFARNVDSHSAPVRIGAQHSELLLVSQDSGAALGRQRTHASKHGTDSHNAHPCRRWRHGRRTTHCRRAKASMSSMTPCRWSRWARAREGHRVGPPAHARFTIRPCSLPVAREHPSRRVLSLSLPLTLSQPLARMHGRLRARFWRSAGPRSCERSKVPSRLTSTSSAKYSQEGTRVLSRARVPCARAKA